MGRLDKYSRIQLIDVSEDSNKIDQRILNNLEIEYKAKVIGENVIALRKFDKLSLIKKYIMVKSSMYCHKKDKEFRKSDMPMTEWYKSIGYEVISAEVKDWIIVIKIKKI